MQGYYPKETLMRNAFIKKPSRIPPRDFFGGPSSFAFFIGVTFSSKGFSDRIFFRVTFPVFHFCCPVEFPRSVLVSSSSPGNIFNGG